jgi:hypothetical protein
MIFLCPECNRVFETDELRPCSGCNKVCLIELENPPPRHSVREYAINDDP